MAVRLSALPAFYPPGRFLVLISVRGWVDPRAIVRLEGLKKSILSVTWTGDLPVCSIVPQPTTLPYTSILTKLERIAWKNRKRPSSRILIPLETEGITGFRLIKTTVARPWQCLIQPLKPTKFHYLLLMYEYLPLNRTCTFACYLTPDIPICMHICY
jgi:hypothetical protein